MAEPLPKALRIPDISRFIVRANQLRAFKPAIAYWCEYHAVNQIVGRGLHTGDDDAFAFTKGLLERLENTKAERPDDDAINDNMAGQAYVEQFAQETFARAERTMAANKVTKQTADTFVAAATFFDLTREWGDPDAETLQKIKFAKWNAARILKAIREGVDPNESNPKPQPQQTSDESQIDAEADALAAEMAGQHLPRPAAMEDVPDVGEPSAASAAAGQAHAEYFPPGPPAPSVPAPAPAPDMPQPSPVAHAPPALPPSSAPSQIPPQPSPQIPTKLPSDVASPVHTPPPAVQPQPSAPSFAAAAPSPAILPPTGSYPPPTAAHAPPPPAPAPAPAPVTGLPPPVASTALPTTAADRKDISQAQKHAKWAISALNFEDVPTAVNELRNALAMLGAK